MRKMTKSKKNEQNKVDNSLRLLAKTSIIVLIGLFLSKAFTYLYRIIVARYFGPEVYGLFSLAIMVSGFFILVASLGFIDGLLRYIPIYRGKNQTNKISYVLRYSYIILFCSGLIFGAILFFSSEFISNTIFHNSDLTIYLKVFSFIVPISIFSSVFLAVIRTYEKINWYSFIQNILQNFIKILLLSILIFLGFKSNAIIISYFIGILSMLIVSYLYCKYKLPEIFIKPKLTKRSKDQVKRELFLYSWPIIFLSFVSTFMYWIDSFLIGFFKSVTDVGFYNAAIPIAGLFSIASEIFQQLFFPLITKEFSKKNLQLIKEISKQVGKWIFIINLPLFLLVFIFPELIIKILFGNDYLVAANALRFLSFGALFTSVSVLSINLLSMIGKSKLILINSVIFSIINLILNILLIPKYGIAGSAFATMLSTVSLGAIFMYQSKKYVLIVPLKRKMLRILLVSILPLFFIIMVNHFFVLNMVKLAITGIIYLLIYITLIFITKCLDDNDLKIFFSFKSKIFNKFIKN